MSLDAQNTWVQRRVFSTVFSTQNTLSRVMQGKIRVGAEPSDGDLIRTILDLNSFSVKGYENLYRDLQISFPTHCTKTRECGYASSSHSALQVGLCDH